MPSPDQCVITFPVAGGIFGVGRLATRLNQLLDRGQIGPWHIGQWTDFKHTAIGIEFCTASDGEVARRACLNFGSRSRSALSDDLRNPINMPEHKIRMPEHKFHLDQAVEFFPNRTMDHKAKAQYTIVRLLPMDGNTPQYRIKNKADGHERMVREHELGSR